MHPETIEVKKTDPAATLPVRAHPGDAGLDLHLNEDALLEPGQTRLLSTGIALAVPTGYVGLVADRSSMAKRGLKTAGGVIDAGYRGEVKVVLINHSAGPVELKRGERIAQLLILPVATPAVREVESLDETRRGEGGFGSTGR